MVTVENETMLKYEAISGGGHALASGVTVWMGLLAEVGLTTVLVFTVLMTAVNTDAKNVIHPLCIGLAVLADILAGWVLYGHLFVIHEILFCIFTRII